MADFKVGDKVRVVKTGFDNGNYSNHGKPIGYEAELKEFAPGGFWKTKCGPDFWPHEIELINPEPARFKVGDRVVHERWGAGVVGRVDTVETTLPYRVDFSDSFYLWLPASRLTPENTTKTTDTLKADSPVIPWQETKPSKTERMFKVGDRVMRTNGVSAIHGTIIAQSGTNYNAVNWDDGLGCSDTWQDRELRLILRQSQPAIVALIEHGKPRPNKNPYVHATADAATKEAERLAAKYPGQKFGVYQLVTARIGTVSVAEA